jgi:hypothetical protein
MESTEKVFAKGLFVKPTDKDWLPVKNHNQSNRLCGFYELTRRTDKR